MAEPAVLRERLVEAGGSWYAVLDGAQFEDLPAELDHQGFLHRSLYLDSGDNARATMRTAPQLVWLDRDAASPLWNHTALPMPLDKAVLDRLVTMLGDRPAAAFWQCPAGGDALYKHLRTINKVLYPGVSDPAKPDLVIFRHSDANVLAQILPVLDDTQLARFFGPATAVSFAADAAWSVAPYELYKRPESRSVVRTGWLRISQEQAVSIGHIRIDNLNRKTEAYLRKVLPPPLADMPDEEMGQWVKAARGSAKDLGIRTEPGHKRWAYLMVMTQGRVVAVPEATDFIRYGGRSPDDQVKSLISHAAEALRTGKTIAPGGVA